MLANALNNIELPRRLHSNVGVEVVPLNIFVLLIVS